MGVIAKTEWIRVPRRDQSQASTNVKKEINSFLFSFYFLINEICSVSDSLSALHVRPRDSSCAVSTKVRMVHCIVAHFSLHRLGFVSLFLFHSFECENNFCSWVHFIMLIRWFWWVLVLTMQVNCSHKLANWIILW